MPSNETEVRKALKVVGIHKKYRFRSFWMKTKRVMEWYIVRGQN